jgi:hypothetical protein
MSISYNPVERLRDSLDVMKILTTLSSLSAAVALAAICMAADPKDDNGAASPLAPLAFFTANQWMATLPDTPDGKKISIRARFTWAENHQAIRISNQFIVNGKPTPYIDGLYVWNPQKHAILFWYADAEGNLSEGTVSVAEGKLVHRFDEIHRDGKTESFVARVTPMANGEGWDNEILKKEGDDLAPVVKVRYLAEKK